MMIVLRGGEVIDPKSDTEGPLDIAFENGRVIAIDKPGSFDDLSQAEILDVSGKWVVPGLIDIHVHLREPGFEWKETIESGCSAAVAGGFTRICCMPNTSPCIDTPEVAKFVQQRAAQAGTALVHPIGAVSIARAGEQIAPLMELYEAGCVAFSDDGDPVWDAQVMRRALEWSKTFGFPISCHQEVKELTRRGSMNESALSLALGLHGMPRAAEDIMVARDVELARMTGGFVHLCHVSTARSVELIRRAKSDGVSLTAEVTPHHLLFTEEKVLDYNTQYKMSPPLRLEEDRQALVEALQDGTFDAVASDHAPHEWDAKNLEFEKAAFGILGLQTTLPIMLELIESKVLSRKRAIELLSSGPARCFRLQAGALSKNSPADITVIDPQCRWEFRKGDILSKSRNTPFVGRSFPGLAERVFVGGKEVFVKSKSENEE